MNVEWRLVVDKMHNPDDIKMMERSDTITI